MQGTLVRTLVARYAMCSYLAVFRMATPFTHSELYYTIGRVPQPITIQRAVTYPLRIQRHTIYKYRCSALKWALHGGESWCSRRKILHACLFAYVSMHFTN